MSTTPSAGTQETWSVNTPSGWPTLDTLHQFRCAVAPSSGDATPEIVTVTSWTSTTAVVLRGSETSPIKTHAIGDVLTIVETNAQMRVLQETYTARIAARTMFT